MNSIETKAYKPFSFKNFSQLDCSEDKSALIASMKSMYCIEGVTIAKQNAIESLDIKKGDKIIELGCGLGIDARKLATQVGDTGRVFAVDKSVFMLEAAKSEAIPKNLLFFDSEVKNLPFENEFFNSAYADRLLVSQVDYLKVLNEIVRVVKPEGIVCITDLDYGTSIFEIDDIKSANLIKNRMIEITQNPLIGRSLKKYFNTVHLKNINLHITNYTIDNLETFCQSIADLKRIVKDLAYLNRITIAEADELWSHILEIDKKGLFLYSTNLFTVSGKKTKLRI